MQQQHNHEQYALHVGKLMKIARKARNEKMETVAKAIGKSQPVISLIERGKYPGLKYELIVDLFVYLEIPLSELTPTENSIKIFL